MKDIFPQRAAHRPAFTLIELLVVIAIIGMLVALLLPAIQQVRSAAHRASCSNNLKQLALALHNYEGAHHALPGLPETSQIGFSVQARILPYIEQGNLKRLIDFKTPLMTGSGGSQKLNPVHTDVAGKELELFLCPGDSQNPIFSNHSVSAGQAFAGTNYMVCTGSGAGTNYDTRRATDGLFWWGSRVKFKQITDGLSHTAMLAESLLGPGDDSTGPKSEQVDLRRMAQYPGGGMAAEGQGFSGAPGHDPDLEVAAQAVTKWGGFRGGAWIWGREHTTTFNTYSQPNSQQFDVMRNGFGWFAARSQHPGGANIALADGSVRFLTDDVAPHLWRAAGTRAGHDSGDDF